MKLTMILLMIAAAMQLLMYAAMQENKLSAWEKDLAPFSIKYELLDLEKEMGR